MVATDVELAEGLLFIFRASSSGLEAGGSVLTLVAGLESTLMTGMAGLEVVCRGAPSRLLRVVVELTVKDSWEEVVAGEETGFSGSGAGSSRNFWILLKAAFFSWSRSFTVMV